MIGPVDLLGAAVIDVAPALGFSSHERSTDTGKDEWLTPPELIRALGEFDLDPCSPVPERRPWQTAKRQFDITDNGLIREWVGRVWMNPPYGPELGKWLGRMKEHGNGIALIFARTETEAYFAHVWNDAHGLLFVKGRIAFYHATGVKGGPAGAPSVFVAYGEDNARLLKAVAENGTIPGKYVSLKP